MARDFYVFIVNGIKYRLWLQTKLFDLIKFDDALKNIGREKVSMISKFKFRIFKSKLYHFLIV